MPQAPANPAVRSMRSTPTHALHPTYLRLKVSLILFQSADYRTHIFHFAFYLFQGILHPTFLLRQSVRTSTRIEQALVQSGVLKFEEQNGA